MWVGTGPKIGLRSSFPGLALGTRNLTRRPNLSSSSQVLAHLLFLHNNKLLLPQQTLPPHLTTRAQLATSKMPGIRKYIVFSRSFPYFPNNVDIAHRKLSWSLSDNPYPSTASLSNDGYSSCNSSLAYLLCRSESIC